MQLSINKSLIVLIITAALTLVGNLVGYKVNPLEALPGIAILVLISFVSIVLSSLTNNKIPSVAIIVTLATLMTIPGIPFATQVSEYTSKVNFLALTTPILAYAGIYTGKNLDSLKKTGWKILVLALFVIFGTYIGSALIAQLVLSIMKVV